LRGQVGHQSDQGEAASVADHPSQPPGVLRGMDRGAAGSQVEPAAEPAQRGVKVEAQPEGRPLIRCHHAVDEVELLGCVDHQGDPPGQHRVRRQPAQGGHLDAGVADDHIVELLSQPERLGQGVAEHPAEPGHREHLPEHGPAADRLARQPDRLTRSSADKVCRVGSQRQEVDNGQWGIEVGRRSVETPCWIEPPSTVDCHDEKTCLRPRCRQELWAGDLNT
jgi:hypothetical protein